MDLWGFGVFGAVGRPTSPRLLATSNTSTDLQLRTALRANGASIAPPIAASQGATHAPIFHFADIATQLMPQPVLGPLRRIAPCHFSGHLLQLLPIARKYSDVQDRLWEGAYADH